MKQLCEEIVYLRNLTMLDVRNNELEELPSQLGILTQLHQVCSLSRSGRTIHCFITYIGFPFALLFPLSLFSVEARQQPAPGVSAARYRCYGF